MKYVFFILVLSFAFANLKAQDKDSTIHWKTVEEVHKLFTKTQKPILFFFYSSKADSCQMMEDSTFRKSEVANYINVLFYAVKIDVSTTNPIRFFDSTLYTKSKNKKYHDFVYKMLGESPSFPSIICFNRQAQGAVFQGFKDRDAIFQILTYYAEDTHRSCTFEEYSKYYLKTYPPKQKQTMSRVLVRWLPIEDAFRQNKSKPKKILLDLDNNYKVSCTMMSITTYNNPKIAAYINEHFYPTNFNAFSKDTLKLYDTQFVNKNDKHPYHDFAVALLQGQMQFPALLFFDGEQKLILKLQDYLTPESIEPYLVYIAEDKYKTVAWDEFKKTFKSQLFKEETKK